jgi:hypothetical protein
MFGTLIRNYKNASLPVTVSLWVQPPTDSDEYIRLFAHTDTGLAIHNLASAGHRNLLAQAMKSSLPRRPGEKFEDIAWEVAAAALIKSQAYLLYKPAASVGMSLQYTCFLAEYLTKNYRGNEEREVRISKSRRVTIRSVKGTEIQAFTLGPSEA